MKLAKIIIIILVTVLICLLYQKFACPNGNQENFADKCQSLIDRCNQCKSKNPPSPPSPPSPPGPGPGPSPSPSPPTNPNGPWTANDLAKAWYKNAPPEYKDDCKYALAVAYNEGASHICHSTDGGFCQGKTGQLCTQDGGCGENIPAWQGPQTNVFQVLSGGGGTGSLGQQITNFINYNKKSCAGQPPLFPGSKLNICGCNVGGSVGPGFTGRCEHSNPNWYNASLSSAEKACNNAK